MRVPSGETSASRKQPSFDSISAVSRQNPSGVASARQSELPIGR